MSTVKNTFAVTDTAHKILKNFASISNSLLLKPGAVQKTIMSTSVLAAADLEWPEETAIYDLNAFLGALSLFGKPEIAFEQDHMVLMGAGGSKIKFRYSDPTTIPALPKRDLSFADPDVQFKLSQEVLTQMKKSVALLKLSHVTMIVKNGTIVVKAADPGNVLSHQWELDIPAADIVTMTDDFTKQLSFKVDHIGLLLEGSYMVSLAHGWKWGYFANNSLPITYFIVEQSK